MQIGLQRRDDFRRIRIFQRDDLRTKGIRRRKLTSDGKTFLGGGVDLDDLQELVTERDGGNVVDRQHAVERLDRFVLGEFGLAAKIDRARQIGRGNDRAVGQFGVPFEDRVDRGALKLELNCRLIH